MPLLLSLAAGARVAEVPAEAGLGGAACGHGRQSSRSAPLAASRSEAASSSTAVTGDACRQRALSLLRRRRGVCLPSGKAGGDRVSWL